MNRRVKFVRIPNFGVNALKTVRSFFDAEKDRLEMKLHPAGVHIEGENTDLIIPYSNIGEIHLYPEEVSPATSVKIPKSRKA